MLPILAPIAFTLSLAVIEDSAAQDRYAAERAQMAREIAGMAAMTAAETGRPAFAASVMAAMAKVPRHRFVLPAWERDAYQNRPLPIGEGQTISQPYIVALMTDLIDPKPGHTVLEIGTGSGYQAAVLAELVAAVYTIEIVAPLGRRAAETLRALGYRNLQTRVGDGYNGWPEKAPFDAIIVTAAAPFVPQPLVEQLKPGGKLVIPVGDRLDVQQLMVIEKAADGSIKSRRTIPVRFVPLTREAPAK
ncbi:MAG: protein-L-isoaspartate(D-aspartate) O-methyltransferase [Betaproteobacteria bacterium]|nr:protein-L-isoaspartate(D-aspartate) O-methyltransferase [Betaproteobacteria bacterium]MBI2961393.1 protein-L-isoaspartate(D-aspartate) O-methyltransferase [Betaproteobacteria bacterium]